MKVWSRSIGQRFKNLMINIWIFKDGCVRNMGLIGLMGPSGTSILGRIMRLRSSRRLRRVYSCVLMWESRGINRLMLRLRSLSRLTLSVLIFMIYRTWGVQYVGKRQNGVIRQKIQITQRHLMYSYFKTYRILMLRAWCRLQSMVWCNFLASISKIGFDLC